MLKKRWIDESSAVVSLEVVLVGAILGLGLLIGLTSHRDAVIGELAELGSGTARMELDADLECHDMEHWRDAP